MNSDSAAKRAAGGTVRACAHLLLACIPISAHAADASVDAGRQVFTKIAQPQCAICHTLKDAGTTGTIGPNLDELKPDAKRVENAVRKGVGVMPPYEGKLTPEQIAAVAGYVAKATGAAK